MSILLRDKMRLALAQLVKDEQYILETRHDDHAAMCRTQGAIAGLRLAEKALDEAMKDLHA